MSIEYKKRKFANAKVECTAKTNREKCCVKCACKQIIRKKSDDNLIHCKKDKKYR